MNRSVLFLIGIVAVLFVSGCTQTGQITNIEIDTGSDVQKECPASCDDSNECTADLCDDKSDFKCRNVPRWGQECGDIGVCQNGVCVEMTDNCSQIVASSDAMHCYWKEYFIPAAEQESVLLCDEIVGDSYHAMCYASVGLELDEPVICEGIADQASRDVCYEYYAEGKADIYIFAGDACEKISDAEMKSDCMMLEEVVIAPVGIREFEVNINYGKIYSYLTLKDRRGRITVSDGTVRITIMQSDDEGENTKILYSETYDVEEEDFEPSPEFGKDDLSFIIPTITADDMVSYPTENNGMFYLTFNADNGLSFTRQEELEF